jgi:predicted nuclease of restriction endonuclease-like (RecB) superfamily
VCAQLSWSHYGFLTQIDDEKERFFYQNKTVIHSWSVRELREQIKSRLYQKTESKEIEETLKTTLPEVVDIQRVFKPDYDLQFIQIADNAQEKELEK